MIAAGTFAYSKGPSPPTHAHAYSVIALPHLAAGKRTLSSFVSKVKAKVQEFDQSRYAKIVTHFFFFFFFWFYGFVVHCLAPISPPSCASRGPGGGGEGITFLYISFISMLSFVRLFRHQRTQEHTSAKPFIIHIYRLRLRIRLSSSEFERWGTGPTRAAGLSRSQH